MSKENPDLTPYRVLLREENSENSAKRQTIFDCQAVDDAHAAEQAENAYPRCQILAKWTLENYDFNRTVYLEAYACDDYGDGPGYAVLGVGRPFCDTLRRLQEICVLEVLSEVRIYDAPEEWGPGIIEEVLRLTCAELVVTKSDFWFKDYPKHATYSIETRAQNIDAFIEAVSSKGDDHLYFGSDIEELKARVADFEDEGVADSTAEVPQTEGAPAQPESLSPVVNGKPEYFPLADREEVGSVLMQDVVGNYDTPDQAPEWAWVEQNASFSHNGNAQAVVWEFVLNLSRTFDEVPAKLMPVIAEARRKDLSYLIFHQGT